MDISTLTNLIIAFRAETRQDSITPDSLGQLLQKIVNVLKAVDDTQGGQGSQGSQVILQEEHPFFHIECDSADHSMRVKFPGDVIRAGYVPFVVRWTNKRSRYRNKMDHSNKWYAPRQRGWHLYGDGKRIKVTQNGLVTFGQNKGTQKNPV